MCPSENICFRAFITRKMAEILSMGHMNLARLLIWFHNDRRVLFGIRACPRCCRGSLGLCYSEGPFSCSSSFSQVLYSAQFPCLATMAMPVVRMGQSFMVLVVDCLIRSAAHKGGRMQKTCCLVNGWYMTFLNPGLYGTGLVVCCRRRCQLLAFNARVGLLRLTSTGNIQSDFS